MVIERLANSALSALSWGCANTNKRCSVFSNHLYPKHVDSKSIQIDLESKRSHASSCVCQNLLQKKWRSEKCQDLPLTLKYYALADFNFLFSMCLRVSSQGGNWVDHTLDRRESLLLCWGINCKCERCSDPTELGLYVGSPCCADCAGRYTATLRDQMCAWYTVVGVYFNAHKYA